MTYNLLQRLGMETATQSKGGSDKVPPTVGIQSSDAGGASDPSLLSPAMREWIRRSRADRNLTVEGLSERSGLDANTIKGLESGEVGEPSVDVLNKLEKGLGLQTGIIHEIMADAKRLEGLSQARRAKREGFYFDF